MKRDGKNLKQVRQLTKTEEEVVMILMPQIGELLSKFINALRAELS